jgi:uncharacterized protein YecE (DUF72 family)
VTGAGRILTGTSGFAYPAWAPRFYRPGLRSDRLLAAYAERLAACELNNTFYQRPTRERIERWLADTPPEFRFSVKAQRGSSMRALGQDPAGAVAWLTEPLPAFGDRLGTVLFRVPGEIDRTEARQQAFAAMLGVWPAAIPLTVEFQHPSWRMDEVLDLLRATGLRGATLCATELDDVDPPPLDLTGPFLYVRLRRTAYRDEDVAAWADRIAPFVASGVDAYAFFRHDEDGTSGLQAEALRDAVLERL